MAEKQKTKGVFFVCFGKRGYAYSAYNLALSIKYFNPEIQIAILHDDSINSLSHQQKSYFDHFVRLPDDIKFSGARIDPGKVKTSIYEFLPWDENLYLDIDAICLKDLQPLIDQMSTKEGYYHTDVIGSGGKSDTIEYSIWASNENIWDFFQLKDDATLYAIQSSFCYIKKCKEAEAFFGKVKENFIAGFPREKCVLWGGTIPDELIFSGTISQFGINPDAKARPIFFGNYHDPRTFTKIVEDHYLMSMFGNGKGNTLTKLRYREWYDKLMIKYCYKFGINHSYKNGAVMADKHANNAFR